MTTKTLAYCAMLAALQVVLARLMGLMPNAYSRFSIEAIPTIVAGILFGPVAGGMVGFSSDLVGCLFSGYGYNPIFCLPPILYGVFGGIFRRYLAEKVTVWPGADGYHPAGGDPGLLAVAERRAGPMYTIVRVPSWRASS